MSSLTFPEASFSISFYNDHLDYLDLGKVTAVVRFRNWAY